MEIITSALCDSLDTKKLKTVKKKKSILASKAYGRPQGPTLFLPNSKLIYVSPDEALTLMSAILFKDIYNLAV